MAKRQIVKEGDPILRKKCRPVEKFDDRLAILLDDMAETMYSANGVGLAGPQVGMLRRVVVIDTGDHLYELVNPRIIDSAGSESGSEGCLSCPGEWGMVTRPKWVKVEAYDRHGNRFEVEGEDLLARAFCHELDHLEGVLFKDIATEMLEEDQ